ncbi:MAG TPA: dTDP-4-dehydrorhamnose reductase [Candidatus Gallimonas gallistercoris]|uniref:dTDP-4-dehydrorhamnose reductase n=1 Tax=Candidatus Gallimonas gallistercoris TaxID=2838602 RepID=A0A9D2H1T6_9FIRM|nr:dTDP-4-dehydrorhamnose reductase [Candidatus Gallimonas gallistercoris]
MKVLVTGSKGQLGYDVIKELCSRRHEALGFDLPELDITDEVAVRAVFDRVKPDAVIHCAAWTAVDAAEESGNIAKVFAVNEGGTRNLAAACKRTGAKLLYLSTDYVFDGQGSAPWGADETRYAPLNEYGKSKLAGENAVRELLQAYFIVRIAWVFGKNGNNFVKTMLRLSETHDTLRVVCDQVGTPTYTPDLARLLVDMIETDKYGVYHATNEGGFISWYDFASAIMQEAGKHTKVIPVTTAEYGLSKAARPFNSRLDKSKLKENGFEPLPDWRDALKRYLKEIGHAN